MRTKCRSLTEAAAQHPEIERLRRDLQALELPDNDVDEPSKQQVRAIYQAARGARLAKAKDWLEDQGATLSRHFANGSEIEPDRIDPEVALIEKGTVDSEIFRLATMLWSVPVSQGFGRRLRFLVRDRNNTRVIGVFAIGDPVFNLKVRDDWIGWSAEQRKHRLVHIAEGHVIGAVPPYTALLGAKLIAALATSREVLESHQRRYRGKCGTLSGAAYAGPPSLLTTMSALGRSSVYNRLHVNGWTRYVRLGSSSGYGHFQINEKTFESLRRMLEAQGHRYAQIPHYGEGGNWRLRVVRAALASVGVNGDTVLRHGVRREAWAAPLHPQWRDVIEGRHPAEIWTHTPTAEQIGQWWRNRWAIPRARRNQEWRKCERRTVLKTITAG